MPSLRAIYKFLPYHGLISVCLGFSLIIIYFFILNNFILNKKKNAGKSGVFKSKVFPWNYSAYIVILIFAIAAFIIYPIADSRKDIGKGSTGDDAMIVAALTIPGDGRLYDVALYDGAPVSPGPGWILLNAPFALLDIFWLCSVSYIFLSIFLYRQFPGRNRPSLIILLLLSTSLFFWEMLVNGHDLIAIGFSFVVLAILAFRYFSQGQSSLAALISLAFLVCVVSTSRIVFIFLPVLLGILAAKKDIRKAIYFMLASILVALIFHGFYFSISDYYQPLHLLRRGSGNVALPIIIIGMIATLGGVITLFYRKAETLEDWFLSIFYCLAIPLAFIAFGELNAVGWDFSKWEGANNLMPAIPAMLFYIGERFRQ